jgi:zona occludens toxin
MSSKIYWGRPGSYKTSSAVSKDLPDFAFNGRTVITNVRGLDNQDRVVRVLEKKFKKKVPATFKLINIESKTIEGRDKWAKFFHWAPVNSAFIVDEAQDVWRKKWNQKYLDDLEYPGGANKADEDKRPLNFEMAFDQHRHYNWDFVLTTPHIKKIRDDIREICDVGIKYVNMALIGISGKHKWFSHDPDNNCLASQVDAEAINQVIPPWAFDLYESTETGDILDTRNGTPFWKNKKLQLLLVVAICGYTYVGFNLSGLITRFSGSSAQASTDSTLSNPSQNIGSAPVVPTKQKTNLDELFSFVSLTHPEVFLTGSYTVDGVKKHLFNIKSSDEKTGVIVDDNYFRTMGYSIIEIHANLVLVGNAEKQFYIKSRGSNDKSLF